jgi:chromosome partitioning protein
MSNGVLVGGQKGGTGKSTTATNLAVMSALMNHDTVLVDTDDDQYNASNFIQHRNELNIHPSPECIQLTGKIHHELGNLAKRYERVIVDAGGRDSPELRYAMSAKCINTMISPIKPSDYDLQTLQNIDDLVMFAQGLNPNLVAYMLFSQCNTHVKDKSVKDAETALALFDHIKLCNTRIGYRMVYQYHVSTALSVVEYEADFLSKQPAYRIKTPKASLEMIELYEFVYKEKFKYPPIDQFTTENLKEIIA